MGYKIKYDSYYNIIKTISIIGTIYNLTLFMSIYVVDKLLIPTYYNNISYNIYYWYIVIDYLAIIIFYNYVFVLYTS